ncbi:hypothetical protein [Pseudoalteromonas sp. S1727]|nr:hypothetical protein [Pseudoalteromonas sp. S1727]
MTKSPSHPHGIKGQLEYGPGWRVKEIITLACFHRARYGN